MSWLRLRRLRRFWRPAPLKRSYDVVIVGGGIHGLATAYYLARTHGIRDVAVLEAHYVGFGGSGRNTAIVRANQRTPENVRLYYEGLKLWRVLTDELDSAAEPLDGGDLVRVGVGRHEDCRLSANRGAAEGD